MLSISVDNEMSAKDINRTGNKTYLDYNFHILKDCALCCQTQKLGRMDLFGYIIGI